MHAVAARRSWFRVDGRTVGSRGWAATILSLESATRGGLDKTHLLPNVSGSGLAEFSLFNHVRLEVLDVAVEHWECDD